VRSHLFLSGLAACILGALLAFASWGEHAQATTFIQGSSGACSGSTHWDSSYKYEYVNYYIGSNDYVTGYSLKQWQDSGTCEAAVGYTQSSTWSYASVTVELILADSCNGYAYYSYLVFYNSASGAMSANTGIGHANYQNCTNGHWYETDNYADYHDWFNNDWYAYGSLFD
jgi:hypothetical protein